MSGAKYAEFVGTAVSWTPVEGESRPGIIREMRDIEGPDGAQTRIVLESEGELVDTAHSRVEVLG